MNSANIAQNKQGMAGTPLDSQLNMSMLSIGKTQTKGKQIVVRFDQHSYDRIWAQAKAEHRGLGEFVRHAALDYVEKIETLMASSGVAEGQMRIGEQ